MSDKFILDNEGNPVAENDLSAWGSWYQDNPDQRRLANDKIGDVRISTVFLGLDHSFGGGEPVLWETMIFEGQHDGYQERYTSKGKALEGHKKAVELVKTTTKGASE